MTNSFILRRVIVGIGLVGVLVLDVGVKEEVVVVKFLIGIVVVFCARCTHRIHVDAM